MTICTQNRECLFGEIVDGAMHLNQMAEMVATVWNDLPHHYSGVDVDAFVIMPNHVHGIVMLSAGQPRGLPLHYRFRTSCTASNRLPPRVVADVRHAKGGHPSPGDCGSATTTNT